MAQYPLDYSDILGKTFNQLTVIKLGPRKSSSEQTFHCKCDCGNFCFATKYQLIHNKLKSCGCRRRDKETIIGNKYNQLMVIGINGRNNQKQQLYLCKCDCGNTVSISKYKLINNVNKSCGCLLKEIQTKYSDLIGQRFGKLIVIEKLGSIAENRSDIYWKCHCDCGNDTQVTTGNLIHGHIKGCGCGKIELIREYRKSQGKNPDVPIKTERELLRGIMHKTGLNKSIFVRDNYTCQLCNAKGGKLHIHHIIPVHINESLTLEPKNLITLCNSCHISKAHEGNTKTVNIFLQQQFASKTGLIIY